MPIYNVTIPCTMAVCVTVEADNPKAAEEAAMAVEWWVEIKSETGEGIPEIVEMQTHRKVAYGNVYEGCINEIEVIEA